MLLDFLYRSYLFPSFILFNFYGTAGRFSCSPYNYLCGHTLQTKGYRYAVVANRLYQCNSYGNDVYEYQDCMHACIHTPRRGSYCASCMPNHYYCSSELQPGSYSLVGVRAQGLYYCSSRGVLSYNKTCTNCVTSINSNSYCAEFCVDQRLYCGRDLAQLGEWDVPLSLYDSLFQCMGGTEVRGAMCEQGCISGEDPHCLVKCVSGALYCGSELAFIETWSEPNTVYQCTNDGRGAMKIKVCRGICQSGTCSEECTVGSHYCGHQLHQLEGWNIAFARQDHVYLCTDNVTATVVSKCMHRKCVAGDLQPVCSCQMGLKYCGFELQDIGFRGLHTNNLYHCGADGLPVMIQTCRHNCSASLSTSFCNVDCVEGNLYCGHEVTRENLDVKSLYVCTNGGFQLIQKCHSSCSGRFGNSHCTAECTEGVHYCPTQLNYLGFSIPQSSIVYLCTNETTVAVNKTCATRCKMDVVGMADCADQCEPGLLYCGHELRDIGFTGGTINALYKCVDKQSVVLYQMCHGPCISDQGSPFCSQHIVTSDETCGTKYSDPTLPFIRDGQASTRETWPWMVSLRSERGHACAGVLVNEQWVLTAADCHSNREIIQWAIISEHKLNQYDRGQVNVSIARVVPYSTNVVTGSGQGIALVQLAKRMQQSRFIRPLCLPQDALEDVISQSSQCVIAGWGLTYDHYVNDTLQYRNVEIMRNHGCVSSEDESTGNVMCVRSADNEVGFACAGDKGGPLMCQRTDGSWVIHAIVTNNLKATCRSADRLPLMLTSVASLMPWIKQVIANESVATDWASSSDMEFFTISEPELQDHSLRKNASSQISRNQSATDTFVHIIHATNNNQAKLHSRVDSHEVITDETFV